MNIDEQVTYLMQGTEYGDDKLKEAMTGELRQRLAEGQAIFPHPGILQAGKRRFVRVG
jgi:hypothetical protein